MPWIKDLLSGTMDSKWYCKLPWTGFSNDPDGKARPCCLYKDHIKDDAGKIMYVQTSSVKEIFSSKYMKDLRQQFRDGARPNACETCIVDEQNNYTSKRQRHIEGDFYFLPDYSKEPEFPVEYQMILSNACNLKCRSCTPSHSSLWQAEHKVIWGNTGYKMPEGQSGENDSVLWNKRSEWMPSVARLEIVGGEPFYINRWKIMWQEFIEQDLAKNINMDISTNCTIYAGDIVAELVKNFRHIGLGLSVDGMGKVYNYLRHPGEWEEVKANMFAYNDMIKTINRRKIGPSVSHTIGWINAWQLPEFHTFVKDNLDEFKIWNNIIHYPPHMAVYMIPATLKDRIRDKWATYDWGRYKNDIAGIVSLMYSQQPSDDEIKQAYKTFNQHDIVRNENLLDILPEEIVEEIRPYYE
jgi:hypothetical protein